MRRFIGYIGTEKDGSNCEFEFQVQDGADVDEIEEEARQAAFDKVNWYYKEVKTEEVTKVG